MSKAEAVCVDRCVAKFLSVHESVGKKMQEETQKMMAAAQQQ